MVWVGCLCAVCSQHTHLYMDQRGWVPHTTTPRGEVMTSVSIPRFSSCSLIAGFLPLPRQPNPATLNKAHAHTHTHTNCVYMLGWRHTAAYPVDMSCPWTWNTDMRTLSHCNFIHLNLKRRRQGGNNTHIWVRTPQKERAARLKAPLFSICVQCHPHMQMHAHYYVFA